MKKMQVGVMLLRGPDGSIVKDMPIYRNVKDDCSDEKMLNRFADAMLNLILQKADEGELQIPVQERQ